MYICSQFLHDRFCGLKDNHFLQMFVTYHTAGCNSRKLISELYLSHRVPDSDYKQISFTKTALIFCSFKMGHVLFFL
jgi:hypothetical protein